MVPSWCLLPEVWLSCATRPFCLCREFPFKRSSLPFLCGSTPMVFGEFLFQCRRIILCAIAHCSSPTVWGILVLIPFFMGWIFAPMFRRLDSVARLFLLAWLLFWQEGTPSSVLIPFWSSFHLKGLLAPAPCCIEGFFLELLSRMPTLSWGGPVEWSSCLASITRCRFFGSCPFCCMRGSFLEPLCTCPLYFGVSSGVPVYLASVVCLRFFSSYPLLHRGLLLGTSCAHAHFISGRPVEYLSIWSSIMRLSSCGSCLFAIQRASSWSLLLRMPALSWGVQWSAYLSGLRRATSFLQLLPLCYTGGASSWSLLLRMPALSWGVQWSAYLSGLRCATSFLPLYFGRLFGYHRIDPPFIRASVCRSFLSDIFLQASLSSRPGSWLFSRR